MNVMYCLETYYVLTKKKNRFMLNDLKIQIKHIESTGIIKNSIIIIHQLKKKLKKRSVYYLMNKV